jgi:hypothetical protein
LETDRNLAQLIPIAEISLKCREAAAGSDASVLLAACRQMATSLARRASSMAAEVQKKPVPAAAPLAGVPLAAPPGGAATRAPVVAQEVPGLPAEPVLPLAASAGPVAPPTPGSSEEAALAQAGASGLVPEAPSTSRFDAERIKHLTVLASAAEREASIAALESGRRFAWVEGATVIDTETNRMWQAQLLNGLTHTLAVEAARRMETGGYCDWRLPTSEELQALLSGSGLEALRGLGVFPGTPAPYLWTSTVRSRFLGFRKDAAVFHSATGELSYRRLSDSSVGTLAVRGS